MDEDEALPLLKYAFDRGINTWDTVCLELPATGRIANLARQMLIRMVVRKKLLGWL